MAKKSQAPPRSFEDALRELEEIVAEIERGNTGLEDSIARYERGGFLIQFCQGILNSAEKQIEAIAKAPDAPAAAGQSKE